MVSFNSQPDYSSLLGNEEKFEKDIVKATKDEVTLIEKTIQEALLYYGKGTPESKDLKKKLTFIHNLQSSPPPLKQALQKASHFFHKLVSSSAPLSSPPPSQPVTPSSAPPLSNAPLSSSPPPQPVASSSPLPLSNSPSALPSVSLEKMKQHFEEIAKENNPASFTQAQKMYEARALKYIDKGQEEEAFRIWHFLATETPVSPDNPLFSWDQEMKALNPPDSKSNPLLGHHFGGLGTDSLKMGVMRGVNREIDGKSVSIIDFKLSSFARNGLAQKLQAIENDVSTFKKYLPPGCTDVTVDKRDYRFTIKTPTGEFTSQYTYNPGTEEFIVDFEGLGRISVGNNPDCGCLYNLVTITLEAEKQPGDNLKKLHQILSLIGCGQLAGVQSVEDARRIQVAQLFRAYYPKEATELEKSNAPLFYNLPIGDLHDKDIPAGDLRRVIIAQVPKMKDIFEKYFITSPELMKKKEICPGEFIWCVEDLHEQVQAAGAWGLMSGIKSFNSIKIILTEGACASEIRFRSGIGKEGASSADDLNSGGGDQVFTRMIGDVFANVDMAAFPLAGKLQVAYRLDVINRVSYGHPTDAFGLKSEGDPNYFQYATRMNLVDFYSGLSSSSRRNEVMVKHRIGPEYLAGVLVQTPEDKEQLIAFLKKEGLVTQQGNDFFICGKKVEDFIHVGRKFKKEIWS